MPEITTTQITVDKRGDKLFIDPNQNDEADTVAAPYSVRPNYQPTVSTPLHWNELTLKLNPFQFSIDTIQQRIGKKGDLFKKVMDKKIAAKNSKLLQSFL